MGLVASLGSISQLAVSLIQSKAMVLALQYRGYSSRGLLCEERKSVIILRPPICGEVTGFAFLASSYCADMSSGIEWDCKFKSKVSNESLEISWSMSCTSKYNRYSECSIHFSSDEIFYFAEKNKQRTCVFVGQVESFSKKTFLSNWETKTHKYLLSP